MLRRGKWEIPKIRNTFLKVSIIRAIAIWGLYWGPPILGNYQITRIRTGIRYHLKVQKSVCVYIYIHPHSHIHIRA